ncbi:hypothetical protein [Rhizohabitans arisaemae]|uniref:hypothetical protein n=1 Tax=Rhizohabitans arisaemae TaxID=2720610 RepID=UPI0024B1EDF1|nr:hypothetical protein [Rhizohabitans arisaemae]
MSTPAGRKPGWRILGAVVLTIGSAAVMATTPSQASGSALVKSSSSIMANQDGICSGGEICFAAQSVGNQSLSDFSTNDANLNNNQYLSPGVNRGLTVGNTARWAWNYDSVRTAVICTGVNYTGSCAGIPPNSGGQLNVTYRANVESVYWQ